MAHPLLNTIAIAILMITHLTIGANASYKSMSCAYSKPLVTNCAYSFFVVPSTTNFFLEHPFV
jgi:hypothetical protein